ncbi:MAG: FadR family transcriptional regulator [Planctomycetes bacterium]|nr:FadR family transcriptional regulator [Planctomycetota bacterium]
MPSGIKPLSGQKKRVALVDQVVESLTQRVIAEEWKAGEYLPPEAELAQMLAVSRTVVREAMRLLGARGLVEVAHGKRPRVQSPNTSAAAESLHVLLQRGALSLTDLAEVRRPLEADIAALAAERITDAQIELLEQSIAAQHEAVTLEEQVAADLRFHEQLAEATGNPIFKLLLGSVTELLLESRRHTIAKQGIKQAIDHHQRILEAVRRHDVDCARAAMVLHVDTSLSDLKTQTF